MLPRLEVCIDQFSSARAALAGGAGRIEVCGSLDLGGLTPSFGLVERCVDLAAIDVMVMIRPHGGGFCYGRDDIETMAHDIRVARQLRVHGVVLGALTPDGRVDREICRRLIDIARPLTVTFHRAFDLVADPLQALDCLLDLEVDRVLTSGRASRALDGSALIRRLVERAGAALIVMAGGGVTAEHTPKLIHETGIRELHASASEAVPVSIPDTLGLTHSTRVTSTEKVRAIVAAMRSSDMNY